MKTPRSILLIAFFLGLAALEIAHGVSRINSIRGARRSQILEEVSLQHDRLGDGLSPLLGRGSSYASLLADSTWVEELVTGSGTEERARSEFVNHLTKFTEIDEVRVIDRTAHEVSRAKREARSSILVTFSATGDGVAVSDDVEDIGDVVIPDSGVATMTPDREKLVVASSHAPGEVVQGDMVSGKLEYLAAVRDEVGQPVGAVVLTAYATPFLDQVRTFQPVTGATAFLVNRDGLYLAHRDQSRELSGLNPGTLRRDHDDVAETLLAGQPTTEGTKGTYFATGLSAGTEGWSLVTWVDSTKLDELAAVGVQAEYTWIIFSTLLVMVLITAAMAFFMRLSNREIQLRESQYYLAKQREMERQLAIAERLGSLGQLTAGVAHEINNPLEGIGNYLSLLEQDKLPEEKRKKFLGLVRHGFERIRDIVRDLSSFSRPDANQEYADLSQVVRQAMQLVNYNKEFKEVEVELLGFEESVGVQGDPGRLEQVFINLLLNAARVMEGPGKVRIEAHREASEDGERIVVRVDDTGPGIAEDVLGKIFDPFFSTTDGTGLGLAVSFSIIRVHGGQLTAENLPGGGARFIVQLPARASAVAETADSSR